MATPAHCLACFEALDAHLSPRRSPPLSLSEIESSYAQWQQENGSSQATDASSEEPRGAKKPSSSSSSTSTTTTTTTTSEYSSVAAAAAASSSTPLFVTWNTLPPPSSSAAADPSLRGCIGTFEAQPLETGVPEYALIAALHDTRFRPVTARELPALQVAVTLLTDFEPVADKYDWEIGTHGIKISFGDPQQQQRRYGATYLPDVAAEQGWTQDEALYSLVRKAGWGGPRAAWKELELAVTRYQGKKTTLDYAEYRKWKDWEASRRQ
ncbi:ammecr1 family protein [Moelleriella libera RCEF 2490]|uniref:Ammecr1 family protein n=1 Tax=Moelleriella libera RCEF 2490 TaxID=1081109 RepID=A0A168AR25_9HYPO|nr:ammecr1 family protein [Moelleriella libera RCEF 2490]